MKGYGLALCSVVLVSLAQLLLRTAMLQFPAWPDILTPALWQHPLPLVFLFIGLSAYALSMLCWIISLRHLALNRAYPLLSISYVLVWLAAISLPIFGETFRWSSLAGVGLIVAGLLCVSLPGKK
ncbi:4-amino-4-deoxy-L-arabinose-phosphoundecaprenol flippase subunit ArnF [Pantoea cypripedii]|uniref:Probable 4-amino-4-deoxy-L-arabinose-phosphoundecaprenol flippase subunit ArnF n=1 Tax=Pantoea cypripedii TaxID=55209 RepID=A0A6B9G8X5_PANCY|nr:4-amino-4-deoxy-L-arabinose-phosphoundecaprenol flippase subunit ArnF [Pantoea cypripedii]QGY31780.1 4-amino-4-deoxy-L-arabinose-phospho-UDP flippase [Pantoea cypripedii]